MVPLILSRNVGAPREVLWRFLSTASGLSCWQADSVEGGLDEGQFRLRWPQLGARLDLSIDGVEEGHRLILRTGDSVLDMTVGEGRIALSHSGLHPEDDLVGLESSWRTALGLLDVAATRHPERTRQVKWLFHPVEAGAELCHYFFTDARALASWLGSPSSPLKMGERFCIEVAPEQRLSGEVLTADRDVCLRVEEMGDGAMALRSLPGPEDTRVVAIGLSSWHQAPEPQLVETLESSLQRLARLSQTAQS